jgi:hypothetical protein
MATFTFATSPDGFWDAARAAQTLYVVAPAAALTDGSAFAPGLFAHAAAVYPAAVLTVAAALAETAGGGSVNGSAVSSVVVVEGCPLKKLVLVPLPDRSSRLYSPTQSMAISGGLHAAGLGGTGGVEAVLVFVGDEAGIGPAACGIGRGCPLFSKKTKGEAGASHGQVTIGFAAAGALLAGPYVATVAPLAFDAVRSTARIAETPCEEMNCDGVEAEARAVVVAYPNVAVSSIVGPALLEAGLGRSMRWAAPRPCSPGWCCSRSPRPTRRRRRTHRSASSGRGSCMTRGGSISSRTAGGG